MLDDGQDNTSCYHADTEYGEPCSPPIVSLIERRINNKRKQDEICAVIATNSGPSTSTVMCQPEEEGNVDFNISNTTTVVVKQKRKKRCLKSKVTGLTNIDDNENSYTATLMIEALELVQNERNRGDASPEIVILPPEGVETDNEDINDDLNEEISLSDIREIAGTFEVNRPPDEVESEEVEAVNEGLTYQAVRRSVIDIINCNMTLHEKVNELLEQGQHLKSLCDWCIGRNTGEFRIAPVNCLSHKSVENRRELCETNGGKSAVEYFELLFDTEFRNYLIEETLRYAHDKGHHQFSFEDVDLNMFVGTLFISGYNPFPQTKMYWDTNDDTTDTSSKMPFPEIVSWK